MGALKLIGVLLAAAFFAVLIAAVSRLFDEDRLVRWIKGLAGAIVFILVNMFAPMAPAIVGLLMVILPLGCFAYLYYWWNENGSTAEELVFAILVALMLELTAMTTVARVLDITGNWVARGLVMSIPRVVFIIFTAFAVSSMIKFRLEMERLEEAEEVIEEEGGDDDDE